MKQLWKKSSRTLRMEQLENRELLTATTWSNAIEANAAEAAEMSTVLEETTTKDPIDLSMVTTLSDDVDPNDGVVSLREAIAAAQAGDTITFAADLADREDRTITLTQGALQINEAITIDGSFGAREAGITIDAGKNSRVIQIGSITGANVTAVGSLESQVVLKGLEITGGSADSGAGIRAYGYLTVQDSVISGNVATGYGGGVMATAGQASFNNVVIAENTAKAGGGAAIYGNNAKSDFVDCVVSSNEATGTGASFGGGGLYLLNATLENVTVSKNSAYQGGGIWFAQGNGVESSLTNCLVVENTATQAGAGIASRIYLNIANTTIANNSGTSASGVGLYANANLTNSVVAMNVTSNNAPVAGKVDMVNTSSVGFTGKNVLSSFTNWKDGSSNTQVYDAEKPVFVEGGYALTEDYADFDGGYVATTIATPTLKYLENFGFEVYQNKNSFTYHINAVDKAAYYVYQLSADQNFENPVEITTTETNATFDDLTWGANYYFRVKAFADGYSGYSSAWSETYSKKVNWRTLEKPVFTLTDGASDSDTLTSSIAVSITAQEDAIKYTVMVYNADAVDAYWNANDFTQPYPEAAYTVSVESSDEQPFVVGEPINITVPGLNPTTRYNVKVVAYGDKADGYRDGKEDNFDFTTSSVQLATPDLKAEGVTVVEPHSITIDFAKVNQGKAKEYLVLYQQPNDAGWQFKTVAGDATFTLDGLDIGDTYSVMAVAYGDGKTYYDSAMFSNAVEFSTPKEQLAKPTIDEIVVGESTQAFGGASVTIMVSGDEYTTDYAFQIATKEVVETKVEKVDENGEVVKDENGDIVYDVVYTDVYNWAPVDAQPKTDEEGNVIAGVYTVSGLDAAKTYYFKAIASADADKYLAAESDSASATTKMVVLADPVLAVENVATKPGVLTSSVNLTINKVENASYYILTYSNGPGEVKIDAFEAQSYTLTIDGLRPGAGNVFHVTAYGDGKVYENSSRTTARITTDNVTFAAPTFKLAAGQETIAVTIDTIKGRDWNNKVDDVLVCDTYLVQWKVAGSEEWQSATHNVTTNDATTVYTIEGLTVGTKYDVQVQAIGAGIYQTSEFAADAVTTLKYNMPGQPTFNFVGKDSTSVTFNIVGVFEKETYKETVVDEETGEEKVVEKERDVPVKTSYTIQWSKFVDGGMNGRDRYVLVDSKIVELGEEPITVEGLDPHTGYRFEVKANENDKYDESAFVSYDATTDFGVLDVPEISVVKDSVTSTSVKISVSEVANAKNGYVVEYALTEDFANPTTISAVAGENTIKGLDPNKTYYFRAYAVDTNQYQAQKGVYSNVVDAATLRHTLAKPTFELSATSDSLTATIEADPMASQATGFRYFYQYRVKGTVDWSEAFNTTANTFTINGLDFGREYEVQVQAVATGDYIPSERAYNDVRTLNKAANAPEVMPTVIDASTIQLAITPAEGATGYVVEYTKAGETVTVNLAADKLVYKAEGLAPNETYAFTVKTIGGDRYDNSDSATSVSETTKQGQFVLNADNVVVEATQELVTITVDFADNSDNGYADDYFAAYAYYIVEYRDVTNNGQWNYQVVDNTQMPYTFEAVAGATYAVAVSALSADGDYVDSEKYSTTVTAPKNELAGVPTIEATYVNASTITVKVDDIAENTDGCVVEYSMNGTDWFAVAQGKDGAYTVSDLPENTAVQFRATAKGAAGYADAVSEIVTATTTYAAADSFQFTQTINKTGVQSVKVVWADNTEYETGYMVQYKVADGDWQDLATVGQDVANVQFAEKDGFVGGSVYTFRVGAMIGEDVVWSEETVFESYGAPTVEIASKTETSFTLALPESATQMRVEVLDTPFTSEATMSSSKLTRCVTLKAGVTSWTPTKLTAGATYYVRVRAVDGASNSAWTYLEVTLPTTEPTPEEVVSEAFADFFAEETEDDFWFEFEKAVGARK